MPFPITLSVADSFQRAAEALSAPWSILHGVALTGRITSSEAYSPLSNFPTEDGAYWTPARVPSPAVAIQAHKANLSATERFYSLWACLQSPGTPAQAGYRLKLRQTKSTGAIAFTWTIEKQEESGFTVLATLAGITLANDDLIALTVAEGTLRAWRFTAGAWAELLSVADASFTTGYLGVGGVGNLAQVRNFQYASITHQEEPVVNVTGTPGLGVTIKRSLSVSQPTAVELLAARLHPEELLVDQPQETIVTFRNITPEEMAKEREEKEREEREETGGSVRIGSARHGVVWRERI
jgi:hypothetical protein